VRHLLGDALKDYAPGDSSNAACRWLGFTLYGTVDFDGG
jgi:hypothetical protein